MKRSFLSLAVAAVVLSGCSLIPDYQRPEAPVAAAYPQGQAYGQNTGAAAVPAADIGWREFFRDPQLQQLIGVALENNRDLRVAALNVEAFRAQYRIQRADLFPRIGVDGSGTRQRLPGDLSTTGSPAISSQYGVTLGTTAWELDLFGRLRSLRDQALEQYLATEQAQRSAQTTLVASVATAYLTLKADQAQLQLTKDTLGTYQKSFDLTQRSYDVGVASALDLRQAQTAVEGARATLAQYTRLVAQDQNALVLLLGSGIPANLPQGLGLDQTLLTEVPAGLPSDLLQRRPDILEAEHQLMAANASIGAARAAFFPSISLTANAGTMSRHCPACSTPVRVPGCSSRRSTCRSSPPAACVPAWTTRRSRRTSTSRSTRRRSRRRSRKSPTAWPRAVPSPSSCRRSAIWSRPATSTTSSPTSAIARGWTTT